jgi:hypothetical protein
MANISSSLKEQISQAPDKEYSVIITLKGESPPSIVQQKGNAIMGNQIFSASLNGKEIESLEKNPDIDAIEMDMEMGTL